MTRATGSGDPPQSGERVPLLLFELGGRLCALPHHAVARVLPMVALARPPGLPPQLAGLLVLDGAAVPVLRLAHLLGLPEPPADPSTALVLLKGASPILLLVDRAAALVRPAADPVPVPVDTTFADVALYQFDHGGTACTLLEPARILLREEADRIAAFLAVTQARQAAAAADA